MKLALVGPLDGALSRLETDLNKVDWCLCTGSVGIWPFTKFMHQASRKHCSEEFSQRYKAFQGMKQKVLFVRGAHDDHFWINRQLKAQTPEFIPNLVWLADGYRTMLSTTFSVTGLGGTFSKQYYNSPYKKKIRLKSYRQA